MKAYNGTLGDEGMVPMAFLQELLELEAIYVGEARLNIARPGQNPSLIRAWGPHASFIYRDRLADTRNGTTFGLTGQWGRSRVRFDRRPEHRPARWSARPCW
ncbi:hypothetical protein P4053_00025 [Pseudomonas aeruginosa]|nr:hypothetical protein [Pseudomonas aeruginosa]